MEIKRKQDIKVEPLPGRGLIRAVGKNSALNSEAMTVGYAIYDTRFGKMDPHHHAEETCIVISADRAKVYWGKEKEKLNDSMDLEPGMILHIPEDEWHAFWYEPGGSVEIIFIYAGTNNIRPEDNKK